MAEGTLGLPSTPEVPSNDALQEVFPQQTVAAMQRGVLEAMLASIAAAQQHAQGLLWICGGDAALLSNIGPVQRSCCSWRVIFSCKHC